MHANWCRPSPDDEKDSVPSILHFEWRIKPSRLKICKNAAGKDIKLGSGAFGAVSPHNVLKGTALYGCALANVGVLPPTLGKESD